VGSLRIGIVGLGQGVAHLHAFRTVPDVQVVALAESTGLAYQLGNQVRYAPCLVSAKALIDSGRFGDIFYGEAEYLYNMAYAQYAADGTRRWRASLTEPQTTMLGGGPHTLDCLRWLMRIDNFVEVHRYGNRLGLTDRPIDDFTVALFKAANGASAKVAVAYGVARPYCLYYSVYGTNATFERTRIQDLRSDQTVNYVYDRDTPHLAQMIPMEVNHRTDPALPAAGRHGTMELAQAAEFVRAIRDRRPPSIDAREAARSCLPLWAALESSRTGHPVAIEPIP
jgi:predicted dehydrogenase